MRQIGLGLDIYATSNDGLIPPWNDTYVLKGDASVKWVPGEYETTGATESTFLELDGL